MKAPSFMAEFLDGDSPKRLMQGLAMGVLCTVVVGFGFGGWSIGSSVERKVETARLTAMVTALAPICADRFERAAKADGDLIVKLNAVGAWQRNTHLMKTGWATFAGGKKPDSDVADACLALLKVALKIE